MAESPKVCAIVLNWNRRNDLLACLASLQKSTYSNMEVVVVDNQNVGLRVVVPAGATTGNVSTTVNNKTTNAKTFTVN